MVSPPAAREAAAAQRHATQAPKKGVQPSPIVERVERIASRRYDSRMYEKISGATIEASDSITNRGVSMLNLPQVIFSLGTAPL